MLRFNLLKFRIVKKWNSAKLAKIGWKFWHRNAAEAAQHIRTRKTIDPKIKKFEKCIIEKSDTLKIIWYRDRRRN